MIEIFQLELISPERLLFSEKIQEVILPGSEGYFSIMANHAPLITIIIPGLIHIKCDCDNEQFFIVLDGFVQVACGICSVLTEFILPFASHDKKYIKQQILVAKEEFKNAKNDLSRNRIEEYLCQLNNLYNFIKKCNIPTPLNLPLNS